MPNDAYKSPLKVGDTVSVSGVVESISAATEHGNNISVKLSDGSVISCNSKHAVAAAENKALTNAKVADAVKAVEETKPSAK